MSDDQTHMPPRVGVLLINLGTPDSPSVADVRRYLREFLSDPRVIDINPIGRWMLLNFIILPLRPRHSAKAYRAVWMPEGSPLLVHSRALREALAARFGDSADVRLAMRYGNPSISDALQAFDDANVDRIIAVPLSPQWTSATAGSAVARVLELLADKWNVPELQVVGEFHDDPGYINALAETATATLQGADHVLFAYHGVPERHVRKADRTGSTCLASDDCCAKLHAGNRGCYRAQCFATSRALAARLELADGTWSTAFQSRFGRDPWIQPFADDRLADFGAAGIGKLVVVEPGFVADCLETIEEIGIRGVEQLRAAGGGELALVPCLNASEAWVDALESIIRRGSTWLPKG